MKRIRIWIKNLNLIQQFFLIAFLVTGTFLMFFFTTVPNSVDNFVNEQMYQYIHTSQEDYINNELFKEDHSTFEETNVYHFVYSKSSNKYLSEIKPESLETFLYATSPKIIEVDDDYDGVYDEENYSIVYCIHNINDSFSLISIVKNDYRMAFKEALTGSTINSTILVVVGLYAFLLIWVSTLIHPLNQIKNYIEKLKNGEKASLNIYRKDEIGEVAEALVEMQNELSNQAHIREEMIQNISHDLKTPIATIKSYSESIKDGIYPYDTLEKSVDVILEHADRLEKKVYSLITFNKLGYLVDDANPGDTVNMREVIQKAILSAKVIRKEISFETEIDEEVYFHGEEEPWRIVVENLIDNALRYARSVVRITLSEEGLYVFNDGDLMEQDRIEKLFKPYEKGNKGNFGLGLSIVKRVTETYGYHVVGENMNDGVIFKVIKPRQKRTRNLVNNARK